MEEIRSDQNWERAREAASQYLRLGENAVQSYPISSSLGVVGELLPLCLGHAFSLAIIGSDPEIRKWVNIPFNQTLASAEGYVKGAYRGG